MGLRAHPSAHPNLPRSGCSSTGSVGSFRARCWALGTTLDRPVPLDPQQPQQPVPPLQVKPIAAARQRARVADHEIPQVRDDRLQSPTIAVHDHERQVGRPALDHRSHRRDRSPSFGQRPAACPRPHHVLPTDQASRSLILTWCGQQGAPRTPAILPWSAWRAGGLRRSAAGTGTASARSTLAHARRSGGQRDGPCAVCPQHDHGDHLAVGAFGPELAGQGSAVAVRLAMAKRAGRVSGNARAGMGELIHCAQHGPRRHRRRHQHWRLTHDPPIRPGRD